MDAQVDTGTPAPESKVAARQGAFGAARSTALASLSAKSEPAPEPAVEQPKVADVYQLAPPEGAPVEDVEAAPEGEVLEAPPEGDEVPETDAEPEPEADVEQRIAEAVEQAKAEVQAQHQAQQKLWQEALKSVEAREMEAERDWKEAELLNQDFAAENAYLFQLLQAQGIQPDPRDVEILKMQAQLRRSQFEQEMGKAAQKKKGDSVEQQFKLAVDQMAAAHGVDPEVLMLEARKEMILAKKEGRKARLLVEVAASMIQKPEAKTPAKKPVTAQPVRRAPRTVPPSRPAPASQRTDTPEDTKAWLAARKQARG